MVTMFIYVHCTTYVGDAHVPVLLNDQKLYHLNYGGAFRPPLLHEGHYVLQ